MGTKEIALGAGVVVSGDNAKHREDFKQVYDDHFNQIYKYCYIRTFSRPDAEDLAMQIFADALAGFDKFESRGKPMVAWLYGIARHHIADHFKRQAKARTVSLQALGKEALALNLPSDSGAAVVGSFELSETLKQFSALPQTYQFVLFLKLVEGLSFKDIGAAIGKKENACRVIAYRAIKRLKQLVKGAGY